MADNLSVLDVPVRQAFGTTYDKLKKLSRHGDAHL